MAFEGLASKYSDLSPNLGYRCGGAALGDREDPHGRVVTGAGPVWWGRWGIGMIPGAAAGGDRCWTGVGAGGGGIGTIPAGSCRETRCTVTSGDTRPDDPCRAAVCRGRPDPPAREQFSLMLGSLMLGRFEVVMARRTASM